MTTQQIYALLLPLVVAGVAYVRAELAHRSATSATTAVAAAAAAGTAPVVNVHPAAAAAPGIAALASQPSSDLWAELESRGWMLASQPYPPAPAAAAWQPVQQHPVGP